METYHDQFKSSVPHSWYVKAVECHAFSIPVGGRLRFFYKKWFEQTKDERILQVIRGFKLPFNERPKQIKMPRELHMSESEKTAIDVEIKLLLQKKAIFKTTPAQGQYYSPIFAVCSSSKTRIIFNGRTINSFLQDEKKFRMISLTQILQMIPRGSQCCSLDSCDAFLTIFLHPQHHKYMCFYWRDQLYYYATAAFGLKCLPKTFSAITSVITSELRKQNILIMSFLDDSISFHSSKLAARIEFGTIFKTFLEYGFLPNIKKSVLKPTQIIEHLGFVINTQNMTVSITEKKRKKYKSMIENAINKKRLTIKHLAHIIGCLLSLYPCFPYAKLYFRDLEMLKIKALRLAKGKWTSKVTLNKNCLDQLAYWQTELNYMIHYFQTPIISEVCYSDSSMEMYGGSWKGQLISGHYLENEKQNASINTLELRAAYYTLAAFAKDWRDKHVLLYCDNTCALSNLKGMGTLKHKLRNQITKQIYEFLRERNLWLSVSYIHTSENKLADYASRKLLTSRHTSEFQLPDHIFKLVTDKHPNISLELFASKQNARLKRYYSYYVDPFSSGSSAFHYAWDNPNEVYYAFPPLSLTRQFFSHIERYNASEIVAIIVAWHSQVWWPKIQKFSISPPILLPTFKLELPWDPTWVHPLQEKKLSNLRFLLLHLSNCSTKQEDTVSNHAKT